MDARHVVATLGVLLGLAGCGGGGGSGTSLEPGPAVAGFAFAESAVAEGQPVDTRFTCDGENVSPALSWEGVPEGTVELALALEDPDAPGRTFTHWLVFGMPPGQAALPEDASPPREGRNDFGNEGYGGPCPPGGEEHRYVFRLLALDAPSGLEEGAERAPFDEAVGPHVLAEARLTARYARP